MFRIGEFSHIGRVSVRQLRFYEEIGLLEPAHTDPSSGYRFYAASQLPRLNQILSLKKLGLALEEIKRVIAEDVGADEVRTLLEERRREAARVIEEEEARFREIEARLRQIEVGGGLADYDLILKSGFHQWILSYVARFENAPACIEAIRQFTRQAIKAVPKNVAQNILVLFREPGFTFEDFELEIGILLSQPVEMELAISGGGTAKVRAIDDDTELLTIVRAGPPEIAHLASNALGYWMESQKYEMAGLPRELILNASEFVAGSIVTEVQFPVRRINSDPALDPDVT